MAPRTSQGGMITEDGGLGVGPLRKNKLKLTTKQKTKRLSEDTAALRFPLPTNVRSLPNKLDELPLCPSTTETTKEQVSFFLLFLFYGNLAD